MYESIFAQIVGDFISSMRRNYCMLHILFIHCSQKTAVHVQVNIIRKETCFPRCYPNNPKTRHCTVVQDRKKLIVIELTVPWETRCEEAYERKKAKYTELLDLCKEKGWRTWLFGVRGFCSQSVCRLMTAVGTSGRDRKRAIQRLSQAAKRGSSWRWLRREEMSWKQSTNVQ